MNRLQRLILVTGAVLFVIVLLTAPKNITISKYNFVGNESFISKMRPQIPDEEEIAGCIDSAPVSMNLSMTAIRGVAVLGATILLYFAAGSQKPKLKKPDSNQLSFFK